MTDRADVDIAANYARVCEQVARAALRCGRQPEEITIVCVAKTQGPQAVRAALAAGATTIGENYVQEAQHKREAVSAPGQWHLIGHLQRNKARTAVSLFSLIHSLDSIALARELDRQAKKQNLTVRSLVEIKLGGEATKTGLAEADLGPLLETVHTLSQLRVEGLMTIPPAGQSARHYFRRLARLQREYGAMEASNIRLRELSMGMTDDYALAIEEGATLVRIGRAIFGKRRS